MSSTATVDHVVVGGGAVGLAVAAQLSSGGGSVVLLERHARVGEETSSRNSGVVHAGLHGPVDSLKRQLCVAGRPLLYEFCAKHGVPVAKTGKWVLAQTAHEEAALESLLRCGQDSGVEGLRIVSGADVRREEPALSARCALRSEESGVVDAAAFVDALRRISVDAGAIVRVGCALVAAEERGSGWRLRVQGRGLMEHIDTPCVINCAGLNADRVAEMFGLPVDALGWRVHPWKGRYFLISPGAASAVRCPLVYPMPVHGGLGVHLTRGLGGETLLGPDAAVAAGLDDLDVDEAAAAAFAEDAQRYFPALRPSHLQPAYAGLRPKLRADGSFADFVLHEQPAGVVHLLGIESPGLTAALALARRVGALARGHV